MKKDLSDYRHDCGGAANAIAAWSGSSTSESQQSSAELAASAQKKQRARGPPKAWKPVFPGGSEPTDCLGPTVHRGPPRLRTSGRGQAYQATLLRGPAHMTWSWPASVRFADAQADIGTTRLGLVGRFRITIRCSETGRRRGGAGTKLPCASCR